MSDTHDGVDLSELRAAMRRWDDEISQGIDPDPAVARNAARVLLAAHPVKVDPVLAAVEAIDREHNEAEAYGQVPMLWAARNRPDLLRALLNAAEAEEQQPQAVWQFQWSDEAQDKRGLAISWPSGRERVRRSIWLDGWTDEATEQMVRSVLDPAKERK